VHFRNCEKAPLFLIQPVCTQRFTILSIAITLSANYLEKPQEVKKRNPDRIGGLEKGFFGNRRG
jgi:hypothetical protein